MRRLGKTHYYLLLINIVKLAYPMLKQSSKIVAALLLACICQFSFAQAPYSFNNPKQAQQFEQLTQEVRCIVCQNQSLAESSAPLAKDLRKKIHALILANKTNAEIKTYLTNRYGEFILLRPLFTAKNSLLWFFPFASIFLLLFYFFWPLKK